MKKLFIIIIVALIGTSTLLFNSCDKVNDILTLPSMSAKVDNDAWTSMFRTAVMYVANDYISIIGSPELSEDADKVIGIMVNGRIAGTYELNPGTLKDECFVMYKKTAGATENSADYYASSLATVIITKLDEENKTISGTFNATLINGDGITGDVMTITEGKFENLSYQVIQ